MIAYDLSIFKGHYFRCVLRSSEFPENSHTAVQTV